MPSVLHVLLCSIAALAFWGVVGFAISRRIASPALALPIAPALGWAVHNALALPLYRLIGFAPWTVALGSFLVLAAACLSFRWPRPADTRDAGVRVPFWAYGLVALLAVVPALALFPKFSGDAVALAAPIFDHSKVAIIDEMTRLGLPPGNPFFGEAGHQRPLAYYYLWHFSAAELALAFGVSGWEADIALSAFTAFSSVALMMGFAAWIAGRASAAVWVVPLAFAASLHPVLEKVLGNEAFYSTFLPPTGFAGWLFQTTWAPQHIASTSCVLLSCFLLMRLAQRPSITTLIVLTLVTLAGYQSSTWVGGILFAAATPFLAVILLMHTPATARMRFVAFSLAAALLTALLAYPFLHDQLLNAAGRGVGSPIAFYPHPVFSIWVPQAIRRILDLPGYWLALLVIEFPAIYIPGTVSLVGSLRAKIVAGEALTMTKLFAALTLVSLVIAGYFTITFADNNDLGWRAVLPGVFVLTIYAATGLSRWLAAPTPAPLTAGLALLLLLLGLPKSLEIVDENLRGSASASGKAFAATPAMWAAVRRHSGAAERVANNPLFLQDMTPWPVNISWALFSDRRSCFAGKDLALPYTALPRERLEEIERQFRRVFAGTSQPGDIADLATRYQCRVAVVTAQDGAWQHDPFAGSGYYTLVDEKPRAWRIYRAAGAAAPAKTQVH
jgi:hypothetical protein